MTLQLFAVCTVHLIAGAAAGAILLRNLTGCQMDSAAPVLGRSG